MRLTKTMLMALVTLWPTSIISAYREIVILYDQEKAQLLVNSSWAFL